jgi:exosortase
MAWICCPEFDRGTVACCRIEGIAERLAGLWRSAVLLFAVPIPGLMRQQISLPLQQSSAAIAEQLLSMVGTDVQRSGCVLLVDGTVVTVAEACNGMRMLFAVLLVVYAMAFSLTGDRRTQAAIVILSPVFAMLMNVIRLSVSAWMFGACSEHVAVLWHDINGWLIPGGLVLALIAFTDHGSNNQPAPQVTPSAWTSAPAAAESGLALCCSLRLLRST